MGLQKAEGISTGKALYNTRVGVGIKILGDGFAWLGISLRHTSELGAKHFKTCFKA